MKITDNKVNKIFMATSIDGYIADVNGGIDWLNRVPNPGHLDMGYKSFMKGIDALLMGRVNNALSHIHQLGKNILYIDGGKTIQSFLKEDLIDEMILTTIPILLGGGSRLFDDHPIQLNFELVESKVFLGQIVQRHYKRKR